MAGALFGAQHMVDVADCRRERTLAAWEGRLRGDDAALPHHVDRVACFGMERVRDPELALGPDHPGERVVRAPETTGELEPSFVVEREDPPELDVDPVLPDRVRGHAG